MYLIEDWEFNVLGIYNYRKPGPLSHYMDYIVENHDHIEGDLVEAGVYKGRSLLAAGLLLKELGSSKKIYGYDSFQGFPVDAYHENDDLARFDDLLRSGRISQEHYDKVQRNRTFRSLEIASGVSTANISLSGDFSRAKIEEVLAKAQFLELDNIEIIPGPFSTTMSEDAPVKPQQLMAVLLDCDLFMSYKVALPFVWRRLPVGGYIFLDEYYSLKFPGARMATDEFFASRQDTPQKHKVEVGDFERWYVRKLHQA